MAIENIELKNELCNNYKENIEFYKKFTDDVVCLLKKLIEINNIQVRSINGRSKDLESLETKIVKKNYKYKSLSEITDLSGIRVITYYHDDVYRVEEMIRNNFIVDPENSIDKAKSMEYDRFGYLSLHYVVQLGEKFYNRKEYREYRGIKFEIQIRTIFQDAWAEIEHDLGYKNEKGIPDRVRRDFSRLAGLLELADKEFQSIRDSINNYEDEMIEKVKILREIIKLDYTTIKKYVTYNETYRSMINFIGKEIEIKKAKNIGEMSKYLISAGIVTLNEVEYLINENQRFILNMIKYERVEIYNYVGETDILLYICYAKLLKEENSEKKLIQFWNENGYTNSDIRREHQIGWIRNMEKYMEM